MLRLAITGGLAAGKSRALEVFRQLGAHVYSADEIAHHLLLYDEDTFCAVTDLLSDQVLVQGKIDRQRVARIVFNHPEKLKQLESILHPKILATLKHEFDTLEKSSPSTCCVVEVPLLFECGWQDLFDVIITIESSKGQERYRGDDYSLRMQRQFPSTKRRAASDIIIDNDGDEASFIQAVTAIAKKFF